MADRQLPRPEENTRLARRDLPRGYFSQLPKLGPGALAGHPQDLRHRVGLRRAHRRPATPRPVGPLHLRLRTPQGTDPRRTLGGARHLRILLIENARRQAQLLVAATRHRQQGDELADQLLGLDRPSPVEFDKSLLPAEQTGQASRAFCTSNCFVG